MKPPNMELVEELLKFLEENRQYLSGEDIVLLNRVIEELRRAEESSLNPDQYRNHRNYRRVDKK